ncbi:triose-phosphate isomerase [Candidatus Parcubacteria bacterium]|nr:triose-phosphate isomerase [Candidatus Parcubacteria bacterium]MBI4098957.1 triose-phosphate isomerase [Candidatus Parcubacteria bacterium]MBI4385637.1 triose-phosphate isomerase [Candidatus Parcubacteria bacterium]
MRPLIIANWKMNPQNYAEAEQLLAAVLGAMKRIRGVTVVFCPPFVWLTDFSHKLRQASFGAQDVFWESAGAYTGEISPAMLKASRVSHVIVGHSERRRWLGETDEMVRRKLAAVLAAGLTAILCVGEDSREEGNNVSAVLEQQLEAALTGLAKASLARLVVAYEPVWAIGTGESDSPSNALSAALTIRKVIRDRFDQKVAQGVPVLYGGSVSSENIVSFLSEKGIGGALVGGASLYAEEFIALVTRAASVSRS